MFDKFIITDHAIERYDTRVQKEKISKKEIIRRIHKDLHFSKIKRVITKGNIRYVFTHHSKEFIFIKKNDSWILKTIIKRNRENNILAINKRLAS